jgi:hypothetical protein
MSLHHFQSVGSSLSRCGFTFYGSTDSGNPKPDDDCYLIYHKRDRQNRITHSAVISMYGSQEFEVELYNSKITFSNGDDYTFIAVCTFPVTDAIWNEFGDQLEVLEMFVSSLE